MKKQNRNRRKQRAQAIAPEAELIEAQPFEDPQESLKQEPAKQEAKKAGPARNLPRRVATHVGTTFDTPSMGGLYFANTQYDFNDWSRWIRNVPLVAASIRVFVNSCARGEWSAVPADESEEAQRIASFIQESLFESPYLNWWKVVRRAAMHKFYGFSIQEWRAPLGADGMYRIVDIATRPQRTISAWERDEDGEVLAVRQNHDRTIDRRKMLYLVDTALNDAPEGIGVLSSLNDSLKRLQRLEQLEQIGLGNDLRGTLIGRAPLSEMDSLTDEEYSAALSPLEEYLKNSTRSPDQNLLLDSSVYATEDTPARIINAPKWGIDIQRGGPTAVKEAQAAIERINRELARGMGTEFLLLGEDGGGSLALAREKSAQFGLMVDEGLQAISTAVRCDLVFPLMMLNRMNLDLAPRIKAEEPSNISLEDRIAAAVQLESGMPEGKGKDDLRADLGLPRSEESEREATDGEGEQPPENEEPENVEG